MTTNLTIAPATPNLFQALAQAGVGWGVYCNAAGSFRSFEADAFPAVARLYPERFKTLADFDAEAAAGRLPSVVFMRLPDSDEHPPDDVQIGQFDTARVYQALTRSPRWMSTALLVTYDEGGGFYDHVPPPRACAPDQVAPQLAATDVPGDFAQYGFRVPITIASAWSRPHFVSHTVHDHSSILRLLELRFGLPAFGGRDANANSLLEFFDFRAPHFARPPSLPEAVVDAGRKC